MFKEILRNENFEYKSTTLEGKKKICQRQINHKHQI